MLLTTFIIQQHAAPKNIHIPKLKFDKESEETIKAIPPTN